MCFMFVLLTSNIQRSLYLAEYEILTAPPNIIAKIIVNNVPKIAPLLTACKSGYFTGKELYKTLIKC